MKSHNKKIKVLIVDDSAFMRRILIDILKIDTSISIVGTAKNGIEALKLIKTLKPDVVTMDIEMPILNGIETLRRIMDNHPIPVIMLSSLTSEGAEATLTCLDIGAVDFIQKPSSVFRINIDDLKKELIDKIKIASKIKFPLNKDIPILETTRLRKNYSFGKGFKEETQHLILMGTSTGGPRALQSVIPLMPKNISASILIVQHMPPGFTKSLAERLNNISQIVVKEAEDGEKPRLGYAYIAPGGYHLKVIKKPDNSIALSLTQEDLMSGHRPSVDMLFKSVSRSINKNITGVIMTGMGADGAKGVKALKDNTECFIIAQDESTSVVYGMPKSAINTGAVDEVLPLDKIVNSILKRLGV